MYYGDSAMTAAQTIKKITEVIARDVACKQGKHEPISFLPERCRYCLHVLNSSSVSSHSKGNTNKPITF
jgi:hypothetical protein